MVHLKINNQPKSVSENSSLVDLIRILHQSENGIALAVNQKVICKKDWKNQMLNQGDEVLIIEATQGG